MVFSDIDVVDIQVYLAGFSFASSGCGKRTDGI